MQVTFLDESFGFLNESIEDNPKKFMIVNWDHVAKTINDYLKTRKFGGMVKTNYKENVFGDLTRLAVLDIQNNTTHMIGTNKAGTKFVLAPKGGSTKIFNTLKEVADYLVDHQDVGVFSFG